MGSGTSQVINYVPPQVNNFYNQGSNYGQGYPQPQPNYAQPQPQPNYAQPQPQPQAPQGYGQGQSYSVPQPAPSYQPPSQPNYGYNAPNVNNYYNQGSGYSAPQAPPSYQPDPQTSSTYSYPPAQGQGYNYNANVPIVNVYNQVQGPRYNNDNSYNRSNDYSKLPAPRPYNNDKPYGKGMQMSPDFIKGFMMASLGMGMLAGQMQGSHGRGYGMGDDYCPPGMKKPSYDMKKPSYEVPKPYNPPANSYDDATTLPVVPYGRGGGVLMDEPSFQPDTQNYWGDIQNAGTNITTVTEQQAVEEMSQMFFFFLAAASQSQSMSVPQAQQPVAQQEQQGFPFPPGLLQLIQGYMN